MVYYIFIFLYTFLHAFASVDEKVGASSVFRILKDKNHMFYEASVNFRIFSRMQLEFQFEFYN